MATYLIDYLEQVLIPKTSETDTTVLLNDIIQSKPSTRILWYFGQNFALLFRINIFHKINILRNKHTYIMINTSNEGISVDF